MPLHDTEAFVLRTFSVQEADKICVFLTRDTGKVRGVAHGARRLKSRYGASLEPFTLVSLSYFQKEHRDLASISNCEIIRTQLVEGVGGLMTSERLGVFHYLAEMVIEFTPDHEPNHLVYRLIGATLDAMRQAPDERLPLLIRYFEVWMLKLAGFFPDWKNCGACGRDLSTEGAIYLTGEGSPQCVECSGRRGDLLAATEWRTIRDILSTPPASFVASVREGRSIHQVAEITVRLITRALERDLRSLEILDRLRPTIGRSGVGLQPMGG
jgi:DNA repair protein RecO (recombination protein O)